MRSALLASVLLILVACGGPRQPIVGCDAAAGDQRQLQVRVRRCYDALELPFATETSHLVEVEVLDGPSELRGKVLTLPYDEWQVGAPPPGRGTVAAITPAYWVRGDGTSHGKPARGWDEDAARR